MSAEIVSDKKLVRDIIHCVHEGDDMTNSFSRALSHEEIMLVTTAYQVGCEDTTARAVSMISSEAQTA